MKVAAWIALTVVLMAGAHWWAPAYALASIAALLALAAHETGPARRHWRDSKRVDR